MIIFISDLDLKGSGYMNIAIALCNELAERDRELYVLGIGYKGDEHPWPFSINPVENPRAFQHIHAMLTNMQAISNAGKLPPIEAIVVALDIPLQEKILQFPRGDIPYVGVFPVESGPLCPTWANIIAPMDQRLVISKFGQEQIEAAGLSCTYLPVGIDTDSWRMPEAGERKRLREALGFRADDFVVLTVADNQERKNLSAAAQMIQRLKDEIPIKWQLVTRVQSKVGWALADPPFDLGTVLTTHERGLSFDRLWTLYAVADAFLLTSKAEGLCMPIIEAMAVGVPVVATNCTAVPEHLYITRDRWRPKMRGFPIDIDYVTIDAWGNSERYFASVGSGVKALRQIYRMRQRKRIAEIIDRGREYASGRTWDRAGDVLNEAIRQAIALKKKVVQGPHPVSHSGLPPTIPQPVPPMGENGDE